jgi:predicted nucleic acid-binding Zn ribbon protein
MDEKSDRAGHLNTAAEVLQQVLQNSKSPLSQQFAKWRLWSNWSEVVGPEIGKNSMPVMYDDGQLTVWVSSSVRLQEMTYVVRALITKINQYGGQTWVRSIRFTLDKRTLPHPDNLTAAEREFLNKHR